MVSAGVRVGVLLLLLLGVPLSPITLGQARSAAGGPHDVGVTASGTTASLPSGLAPQPTPENNSSIRHERLDKLGASDERAALRQWFVRHLSSQLETSIVTLDQGQYDRARTLLGSDYNRQLAKYVDVVGETETTADDRTADQFATAQDRQQQYVATVQEYRDTYREYVAAKRAGNETDARTHARKLNQLATRITRTGTRLVTTYDTIATGTDTNLTRARTTVRTITQNISTQQREIRQETFINTTVTITQRSATASFTEPIQVRGRLTAANGTALADRQIVFTVGQRTVRTRTAANGSFTIRYRPTLLPRGRQSVTLRYVPAPAAVYLGTNTTVPVTITQVTPTVTLTQAPTTVGYNDTVVVRGHVHAATVRAGGVPVHLTIGDTVLDTTRTAANGTFAFTTRLPAEVPAGTQQFNVTLPLRNRALGPTTTPAPVTIAATPTAVTVESHTQDGQVQLQGTLTTQAGTPVPNQTIAIRVGGQTLTTATTNRTGAYVAAVDAAAVPQQAVNATDTLTLTAVYPGPGNLNASRATTTAQFPATAPGPGGERGPGADVTGWLPVPWWLALAGLVVGGVLGGLGVRHALHTRTATAEPAAAETATSATDDTDTTPPAAETASPPDGASLLAHAQTQLAADDPDAAVKTAYTAVRRHISAALEWDGPQTATQTYWEFYRACREHPAVTDAQATALKQVTDHYERARFTTAPIDAAAATEAIDTADDLVAAFDTPAPPAQTQSDDAAPEPASRPEA